MKSYKMLMMAALTILTVSVLAQSNMGRSTKEQMKMKVMKIQSIGTSEYSKSTTLPPGAAVKEQMKAKIMKSNTVDSEQEIERGKSGRCPDCLALQNSSPKEQMKRKVMDLYTCPMSSGITGVSNKCGKCGMYFSSAKTT